MIIELQPESEPITIANKIDDLIIYEDTSRQVIDLSNVFKVINDSDSEIVKTLVSNSNTEVDDPPIVENAISDVATDEDAENKIIDLSSVFSDLDNKYSEIKKTIESNSNSGLVSASINLNNLLLDYQNDKNGTAVIVIKGTSNGKTVTDSFTVNVN